MEVDSNVHPPDAEGGASSAASVIPYDNNNYLPPLSSLHYVVLQLPLEHITSYLSNTSVAFFALAIDPSYSSRNGSSGVAGTSEAVDFLMEQHGVRGLLLPNTFAQKCGHNMPNNWGCQDQCSNWFCVCGCESGSTCFECSGEICRSCNFGEDEFCVDIEWQRCQYCNVAFCHGRCNE